jgi:hypothetical protein
MIVVLPDSVCIELESSAVSAGNTSGVNQELECA